MVQGGNFVLAFRSTKQYSRQKCTPLRHAQLRIYNYKNRNIYILSECQAAIKALGKYQITSKLVWDCQQSIVQLPNITEFN
jgi:hypothetical protein